MELVKLKPTVKDYIWGGTYFKKYNKGNAYNRVSECWELSVRGEDSSIIVSGKDKGKRLNEVITKDDIGPIMNRFPYFPLLIKLIDAKDNLSIQVHPSDDYALKNENSFGKTEMWYILSAEKGSGLYVGLNDNYSKEQIEKALTNGTIQNYLNFYEVKTGDCFLINPGTIHAIGAGVRLIEIQQNSNLTYRLFDYNRVDQNGNKRELHIQKALDVIDLNKYVQHKITSSLLADNSYFTVKRVDFDGELELKANENSFLTFTCISGSGQVDNMLCNQFDTFFLPYKNVCKIKGKGTLIISTIK